MTRIQILALAASALSMLAVQTAAMAENRKAAHDTDGLDAQACESRITNADGEDGKDNASPDSGNGGKGGTIKNADRCSGKVSANGGKGGSGNRGARSGNGGKGGNISF